MPTRIILLPPSVEKSMLMLNRMMTNRIISFRFGIYSTFCFPFLSFASRFCLFFAKGLQIERREKKTDFKGGVNCDENSEFIFEVLKSGKFGDAADSPF
jgi:hypothetical protein